MRLYMLYKKVDGQVFVFGGFNFHGGRPQPVFNNVTEKCGQTFLMHSQHEVEEALNDMPDQREVLQMKPLDL